MPSWATQNLMAFFSIKEYSCFFGGRYFTLGKVSLSLKKFFLPQIWSRSWCGAWKKHICGKMNCLFPFSFQSAPLVSTGIAAARHARSACTAAGPATTSPACATACPASPAPSVTKVSTVSERRLSRTKPHAACPRASPRTRGPVCSYQLATYASAMLCCVCGFCKDNFEIWKSWHATPAKPLHPLSCAPLQF